MNKKEIIWAAHSRGLHDGFINFWMGMLDDVLEDSTQERRVFEYGAMNARFLEFLEIALVVKEGKGIVMQADDREQHHVWSRGVGQNLSFTTESKVAAVQNFDIGFSQEIFSLMPDLTEHARRIWNMLSPTGVYYATFGWHKDNPCSARQAALRQRKDQPFYSYTLDEVVEVFHGKGFEVGVKRLTLPYFMIYDPQVTPARYGSVGDMISCLQDHKILFSFRKWENAHE
ncbi:hypothetical protein [Ferrovum myxofaciens]|uniref:hypothetical protein n=1 Tax=Ferrovum myxofaciens TaxID=416213 RepID=UPI0004E27C42|nr:hypothetical protein [Ferrovum myxofaciens]